uniref:Serine aminopeptidase S33 domain-containing protein n=1 Tax=Mycena chlorophos TaxID=658473 RepID=A0ABQ0LVQ2_MYCCL|nr:predicted protein [Mycena chlorophos]
MPYDPTHLLSKLLLVYTAFRAFRPLPPHSNLLPAESDAGLGALPPDSPARILYPETWLGGGAYATLPLGKVKYWIVGPESGTKVVLIHGLTTPSIAFTHIVPILASANFRVLVYDLYGRGYSDAPRNATYDSNLYVTQLALLLQHVRWERARVVGYSMGGPIAAAFVAAFPSLVERDVAMIASAGGAEVRIKFSSGPLMRKLMMFGTAQKPLPFSGYRNHSWAQWFIFEAFLQRIPAILTRGSYKKPPHISDIVPLQADHLPGFRRAVASSLFEGPIMCMRWAFCSPNWTGFRALFVHGTADDVVPPAHSAIFGALIEHHAKPEEVRIEQILGAMHNLVFTHYDLVGTALVEFFNK